MNGIWCNLPEVWTSMNKDYDVSDMGHVRYKDGRPKCIYKGPGGYATISLHGNNRQIHGFVLRSFIPKPSPMYTVCDHINRNTMDPRLINLRWSNPVLNMMNKNGVRGYRTYKYDNKDGPVVSYQPALQMLGKQTNFPTYDTPELARAVYEYWQRRAYEVIDALCSQNIHWKIQRKILSYWAPFQAKAAKTMKWQRDPAYAKLPVNGRLC
jgi:hypothetical protein